MEKENKKQLNIPNLRFSGFNEEWRNKEIRDLCELKGRIGYRGYTVNDIVKKGDGSIAISPSNINNGILNLEKSTYISWFKYNESPEIKVEEGDILLVKTGSTYGKYAYVFKLNEPATINPQLIIFKKININSIFLSYVVSHPIVQKQIEATVVGGAIPTLSQENIYKFKVSIPSDLEQQKIADFLSSVDNWINNLKQQKENLEVYKKGIMQRIFSQEIRFKDDNGEDFNEWRKLELKDLCEYKNGGSFEEFVVENGKYNLITLNSIDISGKLKRNHKKVDNASWFLQKDDLIMVLSDVAHGYFLGLVDIIKEDNKYVLNQRMGLLRIKNNFTNIVYLRYFINNNQRYFRAHGQGSSQQNLSKGDIEKFKIFLPSPLEQQKIAEFLSNIDNLIEIKEKEIDNSEGWKNGLMQQMFI